MINLYEILPNIGYYLEKIIGSQQFILSSSIIAIIIKSFIFSVLISRASKSNKIHKSLILLFLVIIGSIIADLAWIVTSSRQLYLINIEYKYLRFLTRISWTFYIIYYQSLALFIESLSSKNNKLEFHQKIFLITSSLFAAFFVGLAFYQTGCYDHSMRPAIEIAMLKLSTIYMTFILMPISLFYAIKKMKIKNTPRILQRQLKVFMQFIVAPIWLADLIQVYPFTFLTPANTYASVGISSILITYGIFHCMRKIINIRFLNFESHVQAPISTTKRFHFVDDFKNILDNFAQASSTTELEIITKDFYKEAFSIPTSRTRLYIKLLNKSKEPKESEDYYDSLLESKDNNAKNTEELIIDNFINNYDARTKVGQFLRKNKIIIADELEFSNFYDDNEELQKILQLMDKISADIFIPIFENNSVTRNMGYEYGATGYDSKNGYSNEYANSGSTVSGYIIVEKYARINNENKNAPFYSNLERDQMLVYSNYLGNIIKLFQTRSINQIIQQEKNLKEELYGKQQEINQYKESLEYFLKNNENKKIGVIFYKNRKFVFENHAAHELISVKLNVHDGHPITKKLKIIANDAAAYKSQQTCLISDYNGDPLIACAMPNIEKNNVIILVYYPEIFDILNKKTELLKDHTTRNFLLYLETTSSGKLINDFIPTNSDKNSENLLNFKIDFLKTTLNKKTVLIKSCEEDISQIAEIINKISKRETIYTINLQNPSKNFDILIKLFGINPILKADKGNEKPILEKLDNCGTLLIKNVNFLDLETQKYLCDFIKYGFFKVFRGEKKTFSNVKIILSCNINLQESVNKGEFCKELFEEINKAYITVPSIKALSHDEIEGLITRFAEQAIKMEELQYVLELTNVEKKKLINSCPDSFYELKSKIQQILIKKSKQNDIYPQANIEEIKLNNAYLSLTDRQLIESDQQLLEAAKLGKNALKDIKIMSMLWNKFKNQNKIASLLGVNRSSINRRCKEYNLLD